MLQTNQPEIVLGNVLSGNVVLIRDQSSQNTTIIWGSWEQRLSAPTNIMSLQTAMISISSGPLHCQIFSPKFLPFYTFFTRSANIEIFRKFVRAPLNFQAFYIMAFFGLKGRVNHRFWSKVGLNAVVCANGPKYYQRCSLKIFGYELKLLIKIRINVIDILANIRVNCFVPIYRLRYNTCVPWIFCRGFNWLNSVLNLLWLVWTKFCRDQLGNWSPKWKVAFKLLPQVFKIQ